MAESHRARTMTRNAWEKREGHEPKRDRYLSLVIIADVCVVGERVEGTATLDTTKSSYCLFTVSGSGPTAKPNDDPG